MLRLILNSFLWRLDVSQCLQNGNGKKHAHDEYAADNLGYSKNFVLNENIENECDDKLYVYQGCNDICFLELVSSTYEKLAGKGEK